MDIRCNLFKPLRILCLAGTVWCDKKIDSVGKQLAELLREFNSRSKAKDILESALYELIVLFLPCSCLLETLTLHFVKPA